MAKVTEIAPDLYRISVLYPEINLQFNHFLVRDDEPLLFHTGLRRMFNEVSEGAASIIDPTRPTRIIACKSPLIPSSRADPNTSNEMEVAGNSSSQFSSATRE